MIELAIIDTDGFVLYDSLFRPIKPIPTRATAIHGIMNRHVKTAPMFSDECDKIYDIVKGRTVISYNAKFDRDVITRTYNLHNQECPTCRWECVMRAWWAFEQRPYQRLPGGSHRALEDARAALALLRRMADTEIAGHSSQPARPLPPSAA